MYESDGIQKMICKGCGASKFRVVDGQYICVYCDSQYIEPKIIKQFLTKKKKTITVDPKLNDSVLSGIALENDISRLLSKCKEDPVNAKKYANLVLDIDPHNVEALKYVGGI